MRPREGGGILSPYLNSLSSLPRLAELRTLFTTILVLKTCHQSLEDFLSIKIR